MAVPLILPLWAVPIATSGIRWIDIEVSKAQLLHEERQTCRYNAIKNMALLNLIARSSFYVISYMFGLCCIAFIGYCLYVKYIHWKYDYIPGPPRVRWICKAGLHTGMFILLYEAYCNIQGHFNYFLFFSPVYCLDTHPFSWRRCVRNGFHTIYSSNGDDLCTSQSQYRLDFNLQLIDLQSSSSVTSEALYNHPILCYCVLVLVN